jgi:hypothetical protein
VLKTTLGPIPQPNYIPVLCFSFIKELIPVSIFVRTNELSFEEHESTNGPSGFIYLSITAIYMIVLELTVYDFTIYPVTILNSLMFPK